MHWRPEQLLVSVLVTHMFKGYCDSKFLAMDKKSQNHCSQTKTGNTILPGDKQREGSTVMVQQVTKSVTM